MNKTTANNNQTAETSKRSVCLIVTDFDSVNGGVQNISRNLLNEFNRRGVKTFVCCRNYHNRPRKESINETIVYRSPTFQVFSAVLNSLSFLTNSLWLLWRNRKEFEVIHCQQIFAPAMIGALAKIFLRKPFIVGVHSTGSWGEINQLKTSPLRFLRLGLLKKADFIAVLNQDMQDELENIGVENQRIRFIPNGTRIPDEAAFSLDVRKNYRAKLKLPYKKIAVFTGRLSAEKGLDVLIKAWRKIYAENPQAHLLIIGKGGGVPDVEAETKQMCRELNLEETVHFLGFQPNPFDYLLASDVFVLPTQTEGMSVSIIEAMAAGTAIVTTNIPPNLFLCENNENALLVNSDDDTAFAGCVGKIFESPELSEQLGRSAREKAIKDLSIEVMGDRYLALYSEIIQNNN